MRTCKLVSTVVSWTGALGAKVRATGLRLSWAYSPGALKVLVSSDGVNFAEAAGWQSSARNDVSFTDFVMFATPTEVRAVTVIMRGPRDWDYFGITNAALLAEPGPSLLVSGRTSLQSGCVVRDASENQVFVAPCIDAIATGLGKEIFTVTQSEGATVTFESPTSPNQCESSSPYRNILPNLEMTNDTTITRNMQHFHFSQWKHPNGIRANTPSGRVAK